MGEAVDAMMMTVRRAEPPRFVDRRGAGVGVWCWGKGVTRCWREKRGAWQGTFPKTSSTNHLPRHRSPAMDDISANDLGLAQLALLVELGGPLLTSAYRSVPNKVWFGRVRVSGIIGRFLDMLAVTSINGTGIDEAAAVSLDLGDPVEGLALTSLTSWRTATIRIARNALAPDDAVDFAEKILAWIRELQEGLLAISSSGALCLFSSSICFKSLR